MKCIKLILVVTLTYVMCFCEAKNASANEADRTEPEFAQSDSTIKAQDNSDLIKTVYANFVFYTDIDSKVSSHPERYFTVNALNKLKESYEYECETDDCYAYYELRTEEQDEKPGTAGKSEITDINSVGDNWYVVKYTDMGWPGMTRIKIVDGKIDDFTRCAEDL